MSRKILCICTVFMHTASNPQLYNPRHPEHTVLYQTVAEHFETWLELASAGQFDGQGGEDGDMPMGEGVEFEPDWDLVERPAPDYEVDQRIN